MDQRLAPRGERWTARWGRRALSFSVPPLALVLLVGLGPVLILVALLAELLWPRRLGVLRFYAMSTVVAALEVAGLVAAGALFLRFGPRGLTSEVSLGAHARVQAWWVSSLLAAARKIFRLELDAVPPVSGRRTIFLVRHATVTDALFPTVFFGEGGARRLRFVLKRELLWDPCLDVFGQRLPNAFVARDTPDGERERLKVAELAAALAPGEGLILFPEGTRFSPERRARAVARLRERGKAQAAERAEALQATLPPRLGGFLTALDAVPDADVVILGHAGLETVRRLADVWRGTVVGARIRARVWCYQAHQIPPDPEAREAWLHARWMELDAWVRAPGEP